MSESNSGGQYRLRASRSEHASDGIGISSVICRTIWIPQSRSARRNKQRKNRQLTARSDPVVSDPKLDLRVDKRQPIFSKHADPFWASVEHIGAGEDNHVRRVRRHVRAFRSEEHTSELQSRLHLVCRLLLEKKKTNAKPIDIVGIRS